MDERFDESNNKPEESSQELKKIDSQRYILQEAGPEEQKRTSFQELDGTPSPYMNGALGLDRRSESSHSTGSIDGTKGFSSKTTIILALVLTALIAILAFILYARFTHQDVPRFDYFVSNNQEAFNESLKRSNYSNNQIFAFGSNYVASQIPNNSEEDEDIVASLKEQFSVQDMFMSAIKGNGLVKTFDTLRAGESIGLTVCLADQFADLLKIRPPERDNDLDIRLAIFSQSVKTDRLEKNLEDFCKDQGLLEGKSLNDYVLSGERKPGEVYYGGQLENGNSWKIILREGSEESQILLIISDSIDTITWLGDKI